MGLLCLWQCFNIAAVLNSYKWSGILCGTKKDNNGTIWFISMIIRSKSRRRKIILKKSRFCPNKSPEFSHCTCTSAGIFWLMFYDTQFLRDKLLKKEVPFFGLVTWLSRSGDPHTSPLAMLVNLPLHWTCPYAPDFYNVDADSDIWWCWKNARKEESFFAPSVHGPFLWALHVIVLYL